MQNRSRRSELELRGPRDGLDVHLYEAASGGFGILLRAESDGDDERLAGAPEAHFGGVRGCLLYTSPSPRD
eukprot:3420487-Alexandrium_andersonii.AAC.1